MTSETLDAIGFIVGDGEQQSSYPINSNIVVDNQRKFSGQMRMLIDFNGSMTSLKRPNYLTRLHLDLAKA